MDVRKQLQRLATAGLVAVLIPACEGNPTSPNPPPPGGTTVTGVTVTATPNPVQMPTGVQVTAVVAPSTVAQSVTWSSSNPTAATVSSAGAVTPLRQGSVTITATSTVDPTKSGSVTLSVSCPDPRLVTANLTSDTNWQNWVPDPTCFDYVVQANLLTDDEVLTIDPGTVVGFEAGLQLRVRSTAGLVAAGTAAEPIVLTGFSKQRGFWKGLALENPAFTGNIIQHTTIEYTGGSAISNTQDANLIVNGGVSVQLENSTLQEGAGYGLFLGRDVAITGSGSNTMTKNAMGAAWAYGSEVDHVTQGGSTVVGNDNDVVVVSPTAITQNASWGQAIYHVLRVAGNSFDVRADLTLTAGSELRFDAQQPMRIVTGGGLSAIGTAAAPIVFTGTQATPGHWQGLSFIDTTRPINRLEYVVVEWGGGAQIGPSIDGANVIVRNTVTTSVTITNTTMRGSSGYGLYAGRLSVLNGFTNNTMTSNSVGPAYLGAPVVGYMMPGNSFTGNGTDEIRVETGTAHNMDTDAVWSDFGVPYFLQYVNGPQTVLNATLTLEPGVDLKFGPGVGLLVAQGASVVAVGTQQNRITLRGKAGLWKGILLDAATATFDFVDFADTGSESWGQMAEPGAVSVRTFASHSSTATFVSDVTFSGSGFDIVFGFGSTFAIGCRGSVYIPTNETRDDHCK